MNDIDTQELTAKLATITVGGKRMTQAVYKQLRCAPLLSPQGELNGIPWGIVNLDVGKHTCFQRDPGAHEGYNEHGDRMDFRQGGWNVVWQQGDELLKDHVSRAAAYREFSVPEGEDFLTVCILELLRDGQCPTWKGLEKALEGSYLDTGGEFVDTKIDGVRVALRLGDDALAALQIWRGRTSASSSSWSTDPQVRRQQAVERLSGWVAAQQKQPAYGFGDEGDLSSGNYFHLLRKVVQAEAARRARVVAARDKIANLRQIFIGV